MIVYLTVLYYFFMFFVFFFFFILLFAAFFSIRVIQALIVYEISLPNMIIGRH